jgi:DNA-binding response OmpR family regulator
MEKAMNSSSVLIVESDMAVRHPLAEYLRECGYKVIEAASTDEARLVLTDRSVSVDVLLSDVNSPGEIDGFGLAKWVREEGLKAQVLLTATVAKAAEKAGELCEHGPMMVKLYHPHALLDRIKSTLASRDREVSRKA